MQWNISNKQKAHVSNISNSIIDSILIDVNCVCFKILCILLLLGEVFNNVNNIKLVDTDILS